MTMTDRSGNPVLGSAEMTNRELATEAIQLAIVHLSDEPLIALLHGATAIAHAVLSLGEPTPQPAYPRQDGDHTVIGPECFADKHGDVIAWKGENFYAMTNRADRALTVLEAERGKLAEQLPTACAALEDIASGKHSASSALALAERALADPNAESVPEMRGGVTP